MRLVAGDNTAALLWGFCTLYGLGVGLGVYVFLRDGPPAGVATTYAWAVMATFVAAALVFARHVARQPCSRLTQLDDGRVRVVLRYPLQRIAVEVDPREIQPAVVMPVDASEVDGHWHTQLAIGHPFPLPVVVAQGSRPHCERVRDAVNALRRPDHEAPHES